MIESTSRCIMEIGDRVIVCRNVCHADTVS